MPTFRRCTESDRGGWVEEAIRISRNLYHTYEVSTEPFIIHTNPHTHSRVSRVLREMEVVVDKRISNLYMLAAKEKEIRDKS